MRFTTIVAIAFVHAVIVFFAIALFPAFARDLDERYAGSDLRDWYNGLKQPETSMSCCGEADAVEADDWHVQSDGSVVVTITNGRGYASDGLVVVIPSDKVVTGKANPTGHGILFLSLGGIPFCFIPGPGM